MLLRRHLKQLVSPELHLGLADRKGTLERLKTLRVYHWRHPVEEFIAEEFIANDSFVRTLSSAGLEWLSFSSIEDGCLLETSLFPRLNEP